MEDPIQDDESNERQNNPSLSSYALPAASHQEKYLVSKQDAPKPKPRPRPRKDLPSPSLERPSSPNYCHPLSPLQSQYTALKSDLPSQAPTNAVVTGVPPYSPTRDVTSPYHPNYQSLHFPDGQFQPHGPHRFGFQDDNYPSVDFYQSHSTYNNEHGIDPRQSHMEKQDVLNFQQNIPYRPRTRTPSYSDLQSPSYSDSQSTSPLRHIPIRPYSGPPTPFQHASSSSFGDMNVQRNEYPTHQPLHSPHGVLPHEQQFLRFGESTSSSGVYGQADSIRSNFMYDGQSQNIHNQHTELGSMATEFMYGGTTSPESKIQKYRSNICNLITENRTKDEKRRIVMKLLQECGQMIINSRYQRLHFVQVLRENENSDIAKIPRAFEVLEKYATNLLKHESERYRAWRKISFSSPVFERVRILAGNKNILNMIGYSGEEINQSGDVSGVIFPHDRQPDNTLVTAIACDLVIARVELEEILSGKHPHLSMLHAAYVPSVYFRHDIGSSPTKSDLGFSMPSHYSADTNLYSIKPGMQTDYPPPTIDIYKQHRLQHHHYQQQGNGIPDQRISPTGDVRIPQANQNLGQGNNPGLPEYSMSPPPARQPQHYQGIANKARLTFPETETVTSNLNEQPTPTQVDGDGHWNCEHCTFANPPSDKRICEMCFKTSGPVRKESPAKPPSKPPVLSEEELARNIVPSQNTFTQEKSAANQKPYKKQGDKQDGKPVIPGNVSFDEFDLHNYVVIDNNQGTNQNNSAPASSKMDEQSAAYKKISNDLKCLSLESQTPPDDKAKPFDITKTKLDMLKRIQMVKDEEEAREKALEQQTKRRRQTMEYERKACERNAKHLVELFRFSERNGYTVDECYIAVSNIKETPAQEHSVKHWLQNDWVVFIKDTVQKCNQFYEKDQIGKLTEDEAKHLLIKYVGDKEKVIEQFPFERETMIKDISEEFPDVQKGHIIQKLMEANGDIVKARKNIGEELFGDLLKRNKEPFDHKQCLEKLRNPDIPRQNKLVMLLAEGIAPNWGRGEHILKLLAANMESNSDSSDLELEDLVAAATSSLDIERCIAYMKHECLFCYTEYPMSKMVSTTNCQCEYCYPCFAQFLETTISTKDISNLKCGYCQTEINFQHLEQQIKDLVRRGSLNEVNLQQLHTKLLDLANRNDPDFRYCSHCPFGFVWEDPNQIKMTCNSCRQHTCYSCKRKWSAGHEGRTCDEYEVWQYMNDNPFNEKDVAGMFDRTELVCPNNECGFRFEIARGGCMHFTCQKCKFEFCSGCLMQMVNPKKGQTMNLCGEGCPNLGFHTHHPRDCMFYVRDMEIDDMQELLAFHEIPYETELPEERKDEAQPIGCNVNELQEDDVTLEDGTKGVNRVDRHCGKECGENMAGICGVHYKEYLILLINRYGIDTIDALPIEKIHVVYNRHKVDIPQKHIAETDEDYLKRIREAAKVDIPLPQRKTFPRPKDIAEAKRQEEAIVEDQGDDLDVLP